MCFFKLIKVHLLVSELYIYQSARCNNNKKNVGFIVGCIVDFLPTSSVNSTENGPSRN